MASGSNSESRRVRRSQAVSPFGVGAIVDLPGEALMVAGLDVWPTGDEEASEEIIVEERLARYLGVSTFRMPPVRTRGGYEKPALPMVRFPRWHFCPRCRALAPGRLNSPRPPRCASTTLPKGLEDKMEPCAELSKRRRWRMAPLRFVAVCQHGHIEDFPWEEWAHSESGAPLTRGHTCENPSVHLLSTGMSGLAALRVECRTCGEGRLMTGASGEKGLEGLGCRGYRPWLGGDHEPCEERLRTVQRGASNVYFSHTASSILIPPYARKYREFVAKPKVWSLLTQHVDEDGMPERTGSDMLAGMKGTQCRPAPRGGAREVAGAGAGRGVDARGRGGVSIRGVSGPSWRGDHRGPVHAASSKTRELSALDRRALRSRRAGRKAHRDARADWSVPSRARVAHHTARPSPGS